MDECGENFGAVMSSCLSTADVNAVRSTARNSTPTIFGCQFSNPRLNLSIGMYITRVQVEESPATICGFLSPSSIRSASADIDIGKSQSPQPRGQPICCWLEKERSGGAHTSPRPEQQTYRNWRHSRMLSVNHIDLVLDKRNYSINDRIKYTKHVLPCKSKLATFDPCFGLIWQSTSSANKFIIVFCICKVSF